jgi:hypothetical protein
VERHTTQANINALFKVNAPPAAEGRNSLAVGSALPVLPAAAPYLAQRVLSADFLKAMVDHRGPHDIGTGKGVQYNKVLELYSAAEVSAMWSDWRRIVAELEAPPPDDLQQQALDAYIPFLAQSEADELYNFLEQHEGDLKAIGYRNGPLKSRPKLNFGVFREDGFAPDYQWGQWIQDRSHIFNLAQSPFMQALLRKVELHTGLKFNHIIATRLKDGTCGMPHHTDQRFSFSPGKIESQTMIFNMSVGHTRNFKFMDNSSNVLASHDMVSGSAIAMNGKLHYFSTHGVEEDSSTQPRWSVCFRNVDAYWVKPDELQWHDDASRLA